MPRRSEGTHPGGDQKSQKSALPQEHPFYEGLSETKASDRRTQPRVKFRDTSTYPKAEAWDKQVGLAQAFLERHEHPLGPQNPLDLPDEVRSLVDDIRAKVNRHSSTYTPRPQRMAELLLDETAKR